MSTPPPRPHRRRLRLATLLILSVTGLVVGLPALIGFGGMAILLHVPCSDPDRTPGDYGLAWEDVTIPARTGDRMAGYFIPGENGAAIIIPPPYAGGRSSRLHEAQVVAEAGYAVLTFDSRRCAGMGPVSFGYSEVDDLADALAYLTSRPEIDPARIGALGFSSAGATAIMAAAEMPQIRAVVAEGGYGNLVAQAIDTGANRNPLERIFIAALKASYRTFTGVEMERLDPLGAIGQVAPRPVLLVYGSRESTLEGARQQAAAGPSAELWIVEGARHGNYLSTAPDEYRRRIVGFFDKALAGDSE